MWYAALPAIDPVMKLVNDPDFLLSHVMHGGVLAGGLVLNRAGVSRRAQLTTAKRWAADRS
jgi:hypothetical protein